MKIGTGLIGRVELMRQGTAFPDLHKGMTFVGRVVSIEGNALDIMVGMERIKAHGKMTHELPINTPITFEVVSIEDSVVVLKPALEEESTASEDNIIAGFLESAGIEPSSGNIDFIKENDYVFSKAIQKMVASEEIMLKTGELEGYIKGFVKEGGEELVQRLSKLFSLMKNGGQLPKGFSKAASNLLKGLLIQENPSYPVFLIPVPLKYNDHNCSGEIWIEDGNGGKDGTIYVHIFVDTPCGRVEASVANHGRSISLNICCSMELIPLFNMYSGEIRDKITSLGFDIKGLCIMELKKRTSFIDIVGKYVKPFEHLNVRV